MKTRADFLCEFYASLVPSVVYGCYTKYTEKTQSFTKVRSYKGDIKY
jgi:hypothetical protein